MYPHELMEMILYYSKPQGDTNPCAHALLERFGSIKGVLDAPYDELVAVDGVGEHTAIMLKLLPEIYKCYERDMHQKSKPYNNLGRIVSFLHPKFVGATKERMYLLLLNNRMDLIDCVLISEGTVNRCEVLLRLISEKVHAKNASYAVIAHNHPNGIARSSNADEMITNNVFHYLHAIDVVLLEHLIFTETQFYPVIKRSLVDEYADYTMSEQARRKVAEGFYNIDDKSFSFEKHFDLKEEWSK